MTYRYPYRFDNDIFVKQLAKFIENDLIINKDRYQNLKENDNTYYVDIVDGRLDFVERNEFEEREKEYFKYLNGDNKEEDKDYEDNTDGSYCD